jgi:hypothetical protein
MVSFVPSISLVASYVMSSMVKYSSKYVLFHCADHKEVYSGYDWLSDQRPKQVKVDAKQSITLYSTFQHSDGLISLQTAVFLLG